MANDVSRICEEMGKRAAGEIYMSNDPSKYLA
jgi:hypothetical protein